VLTAHVKIHRAPAAEALVRIDPKTAPDAARALAAGVKDTTQAIPERRMQMQTLGAMGALAADAAPTLVELLGHKDGFLRRDAAVTLGQIGPAAVKTMPALKAALEDADPVVR